MVNEIPSCMSAFETDDYMRKEVEVSEASVPLSSKANVCRTDINEESIVLDKKHYKKGRIADQIPSCSSDSDQDEKGIQRQRKSRVGKRLVKAG
ncbi:hypothetical protein HOLleu_01043 [Holothuria leucospilota]|uniref:Uncharacterized protein n=1 Tax=Holothuria leucospilota TaxID=206669 RepID=A0A9Q1HKL4_HOLLE|nr:hypothetical protein HOLleu_01043 [Holothuria leucospilota]